MKILFIMRDTKMIEHLGIMYLSTALKKAGHNVELIKTDYEDVDKKISDYKPDLLAFSAMTGEHKHLVALNKKIKEKHNIPTIFGGPHATFFPDVIKEEGIDMVGVGECEEALVELCNAIEKRKRYDNIKNIWVKNGNKIIKNPLRSLVIDLDKIPFPDREIFYKKDPDLKEHGEKRIMITRGCPFNCTYCFNPILTKMYGSQWSSIRKRSVDNVIEEVLEIKKKYPVEFIRIIDDTFVMCGIDWLREFSEKYSKKVGIPFIANARFNLITEELVSLLKKSGCSAVFAAVETADDEIRNGLLKRNMSKEQMFNSCRLFRKYKIKYGFYNLIGLPVENPLQKDLETLKLNIKLKPHMAWSSLLTPYPKTELGEYCIKHGYFNGDFNSIPANNKIESVLKFKSKKEKRMVENLHKLFGITVQFPFLLPITKQLIKLPPNKLFNIIFLGWYGFSLKIRMAKLKLSPMKILKLSKTVVTKHTKQEYIK